MREPAGRLGCVCTRARWWGPPRTAVSGTRVFYGPGHPHSPFLLSCARQQRVVQGLTAAVPIAREQTFLLYLIGTRMRNTLMAAIYRKCLRLSNSALQVGVGGAACVWTRVCNCGGGGAKTEG